jgi:hypothetical protein
MSSRRVTGALMMSALFAIAVASSPALACKGATSLLRDDFTDADPAWAEAFTDGPSFQIGGGKVLAKSEPGQYNVLLYQGDFFAAGDACVTIKNPAAVRDPSGIWAGMVLQAGDGAWYMPSLNLDGTAGVTRVTGDGWLNPVPARKFGEIKSGPNAANVLRVVWKAPPPKGSNNPPDPTVAIFINDKPFFNFKMTPNSNRQFGLAVGSEGNVYQFTDLAITK